MEAVVSMLILGILLTTIVSIIRFSLAITGESIANAEKSQETMNTLTLWDAVEEDRELTFKSTDPAIDIDTKHKIDYRTQDGMTAFLPFTTP